MSYSDERDEIAELFGVKPSARNQGYTNEGDPADAKSSPANPTPDPVPAEPLAPLPLPEIKKPVKLRPPAHVEPHPHDSLPSLLAAPRQSVPTTTHRPLPETPIQDEEFRVYEEGDLPDFSDFDFLPAEKETAARTGSDATPRAPRSAGADASPPPAPQRLPEEDTPLALSSSRTRSSGDQPGAADSGVASAVEAPRRARTGHRPDLHFESDQNLAHDDTSASLLDTKGLVKIYDGRTVVNGVDIHVRPGEIVGLLGPNGAGKTTSFYMIVGLVPPNGGQVLFNGNDVTHMPMYQRARLGMGYLPQEESIFRKLTVEENLMAVLETLDLSRQERLARCQELLERFSITHIRKNIALTCSGGEKRRLTIARSLVTTPSLLMLDEPFSGVDPIAVNEIQNIVQDLRKSGLAILITDHNARQTLELVDRAYLIYEGRVLREGTRDFLINDPVSRELYLGDRFTM
ncbi:MAG: LPS export ABC transporter ATP-binding protein [Verrucomicrobiia bacterium Tous-C2TDCM]|nr:MAG: LPS export ABC transporter ATP-binding protein [Verrucomicrobiae bacterium Tous-C2TDCM]